MEMNTLKNTRGFTLVELLIAMVILGVVLTGVVRMFSTTGHYHAAQEMMVDLTQDLRAVKQLMVQELREAGCDPTNKGGFGFQVDSDDRYDTDNNSVHFTRDIDNDKDDNVAGGDEFLEPDGDADDANEDVSYFRTNDDCTGSAGAVMDAANPSAGCLRRNTGAGGQPVIPGVTQFELQYWRYNPISEKEELMVPPFSKGDLDDVNSVQVNIEAQVDEPGKVSVGSKTQQISFRVLIRNG